MKEKSITKNAILNILRYVSSMVFPLITFPYITRILSVDNLGKVNYASSIVNYFLLIAGLGYPTFAIREGARLRDDKEKFNRFASRIFTMNMFTSIIAYIMLALLVFIVPEFKMDSKVIAIFSLQIFFTTIGMDWVNTVYEEFGYIAIRTFLCQILSLIILFLFVRESEDYLIYAVVMVTSSVGSCILNFFYVRRFCKVRFTFDIPFKKYSKPILLIFFSSISATIYTNLDVTMLGSMCGEYEVGIYSCALKIYRILKQVMIAYIYVYEPRISNYIDDKFKYKGIVNDLFKRIIFLMLPVCVGIISVGSQTIEILAGDKYLDAYLPLSILMFSLISSTMAYFFMHIILLPLGLEKYLGLCSMVGAIVDVVMNYIFISIVGLSGAAIATFLAELAVMIIAFLFVKGYFVLSFDIKFILQIVIASVAIMAEALLCKMLFRNLIVNFVVTILLGVIAYILMLIVLKNEYIVIVKKTLNKFIRRKR